MRYYFNIRDGATLFDEEGKDFADLTAVREAALQTSVEMLKGSRDQNFWSGEPWQLWVTEKPKGRGNTLLTLTFSAHSPGVGQ